MPGRNRSWWLVPGAKTLVRPFGSETEAPSLQRTGHIERIAPPPSASVSPREVQVWLPPGHAAASALLYPKRYLHDGQNVFDAAAAGADWQVDKTAQRLVQGGAVRPFTVVAVASSAERLRDQTPQPGTAGPRAGEGGGAGAYGRYLVQELKPLIDAR